MARPRDEGFSLLEVLFASFIAFFVLTAIFGVIVSSSGEGRIASSDVVSTNLGQLVVEQARSLPYASVGVTPTVNAQQVSGVLPSSETTVYQGITFTIQRDVTWVDDPLTSGTSQDYKKLVVSVAWTGGHATSFTTFIRDHTNETPTPPTVVWMVNPPANAVLFTDSGGTEIWDHSNNPNGSTGLASLQASASVVATTGTITRVELQVNGLTLVSASPGVVSTGRWPTPAYQIDLALTTDTPSPGTHFFREGLNTIRVFTTASNLAYAYQILLVTVDNLAPAFNTGDAVTLAVPSDNTDKYNSSLQMTWPPARDGTDPSPYYNAVVSPSGMTAIALPGANLGSSGSWMLGTGQPSPFAAAPFTAYHVSLTGVSIRGLVGATSASNSGYESTNVRLTGSVFNQATKKQAPNSFRFDLTASPPNPSAAAIQSAFGGSSIAYDVYSMDGSTYTYPGTGDLPSTAYLEAGNQATTTFAVQSGLNCDKYFQIEAKILGSGGTVVKRIRSNVIGAIATGPQYQQTTILPIP